MSNSLNRRKFHRVIYKKRKLDSGSEMKEIAGFVDGPFGLEDNLKDWLVENFHQIDPKAALIGDGIDLGNEMEIDLLALLPTAEFCIVELKRDSAAIDDVAQILHYASILDRMVHADLDRLLQVKHQQTLSQFYETRFKRAYPDQRPSSMRLVLLAANIPAEVESLLLYLNQRHRFVFHALSYLSPASEPGEPELSIQQVLHPGDELSPPGPMPDHLFMIRYREHPDGLWEDVLSTCLLPCPPGPGQDELVAALDQGTVTLLVYIHQCGFTAVATAAKHRMGWRKTDRGENELLLLVTWDVALPRESALFQSETWQPKGDIIPVTNAELWTSIASRLRFRSRKPRRLGRNGAQRRPYQRPKPGPS